MKDILRDSLRTVLNPKSVAVIGASENANKIGGRPLLYLSRLGFKGKVYPINPKRAGDPGLQGLSVARGSAGSARSGDRGGGRRCGDRGGGAVRRARRKGRGGDDVGLRRDRSRGRQGQGEAHARRGARGRHAHRRAELAGPGEFRHRRDPAFSTMFIEAPPKDGPVAVVSQSGAMSVVPYGLLRSAASACAIRMPPATTATSRRPNWPRWSPRIPDLKLLLLYLESIPDPYYLARRRASRASATCR